MDVYLSGKRVRLDPSRAIGKGGEADVFDLGDGRALKVFKTPDHPDYAGLDAEKLAAEQRIARHQDKLKVFPHGLPNEVVTPDELATDKRGNHIVGYVMHLVQGAEVLMRYGDPSFRKAGTGAVCVSAILISLHHTVKAIHDAGVVVGDFNDLNVLVKGSKAFIIDADSFQFGRFLCDVFTERFVDPLLCDPSLSRPLLSKPYTPCSDWYAFAVIAMQSLLCVGPYGGIYKPKSASNRVVQTQRPLRRITVFHTDVVYPKPAIPYQVLPDDLLQYFYRVFERDERDSFPRRLLESLAWRMCSSCGIEHARFACPICEVTPKAAVLQTIIVRGQATATRVFKTHGTIAVASVEQGELRLLYHENGQFLREDNRVVLDGPMDPFMSYALCGQSTLIGKGGKVVVLSPDEVPRQILVDCVGTKTVFAANRGNYYVAQGGRLMRCATHKASATSKLMGVDPTDSIGDVLSGQTLFWVGERFGFGFYRASQLSVAFVFDANKPGIKDTIKFPFLSGMITGVECVFDEHRVWVMVATEQKGRMVHQCVVVRSDGVIEATAQGEAGDGTWLSVLTGKCAAFGFLLVATDAGLVRVEVQCDSLVQTRHFPDTEPFVSETSRLLMGSKGLFVVDTKEVKILKLAN